eukprot:284815585_6
MNQQVAVYEYRSSFIFTSHILHSRETLNSEPGAKNVTTANHSPIRGLNLQRIKISVLVPPGAKAVWMANLFKHQLIILVYQEAESVTFAVSQNCTTRPNTTGTESFSQSAVGITRHPCPNRYKISCGCQISAGHSMYKENMVRSGARAYVASTKSVGRLWKPCQSEARTVRDFSILIGGHQAKIGSRRGTSSSMGSWPCKKLSDFGIRDSPAKERDLFDSGAVFACTEGTSRETITEITCE